MAHPISPDLSLQGIQCKNKASGSKDLPNWLFDRLVLFAGSLGVSQRLLEWKFIDGDHGVEFSTSPPIELHGSDTCYLNYQRKGLILVMNSAL